MKKTLALLLVTAAIAAVDTSVALSIGRRRAARCCHDSCCSVSGSVSKEIITICQGQMVPEGWVIVGQAVSTSCPGTGYNAWNIQRLPTQSGSVLSICTNQPIPPGWVKIGEGAGSS